MHRHLLSLTTEPEPHRPLAERRLRRRVKVTRGQRGNQLVGSLGVPLEDVLSRRRLGVQVCVRNLLADNDSHRPAVYAAQVSDQIARRPSRAGWRVLGEIFGRGRGDGRDPLAQCFQPFVGGHAVIRSLTSLNLATIFRLSVDHASVGLGRGRPCPPQREQPVLRGSSPARCASGPTRPFLAMNPVCDPAQSR
ncbi:Uncharacterised protein [Mycobacteroides abscessus subsp. abscessus]|nr:Uncharacterised protein [Mycobacteroides abscessus subsp. abscessus]